MRNIAIEQEEGFFLHCKGQVGAYLCKSVGLVGLKTGGLVMEGPIGFHVKEYWLSGTTDTVTM